MVEVILGDCRDLSGFLKVYTGSLFPCFEHRCMIGLRIHLLQSIAKVFLKKLWQICLKFTMCHEILRDAQVFDEQC